MSLTTQAPAQEPRIPYNESDSSFLHPFIHSEFKPTA
jgi:hypothetical protein